MGVNSRMRVWTIGAGLLVGLMVMMPVLGADTGMPVAGLGAIQTAGDAQSACSTKPAGEGDGESPGGIPDGTRLGFFDKYGDLAVETGRKYGLPYEAILAQASIESANGLSAPGNNFFGIKAWKPGQETTTTGTNEEVNGTLVSTSANWVKYDSAQAGFDGYGEFITSNSRYAKALAYRSDPYAYISAIRDAGYATASDYVQVVWSVARQVIDWTKDKGLPSSAEMTFDAAPPAPSDDTGTQPASCSTGSDARADMGMVGGAPLDRRDFGWMCDWGGVCADGDGLGHRASDRNFYRFDVGRYQCVWYAWNRLAMIHGDKGWTWVHGNGGDVHVNAAGDPGWIVSARPKPGDGVSQYGGALGGDNTFGHIAVVERVEPHGSGWRILISEGNYGTDGSGPWNGYHTRWLESSRFADAGNVFFRSRAWA